MVGFDDGTQTSRVLDGTPVTIDQRRPDDGTRLDARAGAASERRPLLPGASEGGATSTSSFELAASMLSEPNPHGRPNSDVVRPWLNGKGITDRNPHKFIIDFGRCHKRSAALYELPFEHVEQFVRPTRIANRDRQRRERWWLLGRVGTDLRHATSEAQRLVLTPRVAKHRLFVWAPSAVLPDARLYCFATEQDWFFGVLHSRVHEVWSLARGSRHGDGLEGGRPTYSNEACFETFAFPDATEAQREAIATAAHELDLKRGRWLNPPEWTRENALTFAASVDGPWRHLVEAPNAEGIGAVRYVRLVPADEAARGELANRTLTALYNERPTWLRDLHSALDAAVLGAYGLPADATEQGVLAHLLALNLEGRASRPRPRGASRKAGEPDVRAR